MNENKKYFKVLAKCGHVGRRFYVPVQFAIIAENGKVAARIVRDFPRVKHHHKDAILDVKEIDAEEYQTILEINNDDGYLRCHSKREQKSLLCGLESRIVTDPHFVVASKHNKQERRERVEFKQKKYKEACHINWMEEMYEFAY